MDARARPTKTTSDFMLETVSVMWMAGQWVALWGLRATPLTARAEGLGIFTMCGTLSRKSTKFNYQTSS